MLPSHSTSVCSRFAVVAILGIFLSACKEHDRRNASFYFAASEKNAAFPVHLLTGTVVIFVDLATGALQKLVSSKADLLMPHLSADGTKLLLVRRRHDGKGYELISCETPSFECKLVFTSIDPINSPIEISNDRILYVSSPYVVGGDGRGRYSRNDIWSIDAKGTQRKLTNMELYGLDSLSVGMNEIYFKGLGSRRDNPVIPELNTLAKDKSEMFKLPFDKVTGNIAAPQEALKPLFSNGGYAIQPSVGPDGFPFAFLQARTDNLENYKFNVVILGSDRLTTRVFESSGIGFSRPVVVGDEIIANDIEHSARVIKRFTPDKIESQTLATVRDSSISTLEAIEITIKP